MTSKDLPPPPPFGLDTAVDPSSEIDIDLADEGEFHEAALERATVLEGVEYLGDYPSIEAYLRSMLEPEVSAGCHWLLNHLDYRAVKSRWESDGSRLVLERGQVFRVAAPDLPGPWMPARGS